MYFKLVAVSKKKTIKSFDVYTYERLKHVASIKLLFIETMTVHHTAVDKWQDLLIRLCGHLPAGDQCPLFHYDDHKSYLVKQPGKYQAKWCHKWT